MYKKIDKEVEQIIKYASKYMKKLSHKYVKIEITKAYIFSRNAHEGQSRLSGEPYISHPVAATTILMQIKPDVSTIQACLLHDVIEDTRFNYEDIEKEFGEEVAKLCIGMEKISKVRYQGEERSIGSLRKMFVAMAEDLRVIFIKLADRLHNMETLHNHPKPEKRRRIALETLNIYSPIADRLGLYQIKHSLDKECFKILRPKAYKQLKDELKELEESSKYFKENAKEEVKEMLLLGGIKKFDIDFRVKAIYSIYKKLKKKGFTSVAELHDLYGVRIIVKDVTTCYRVLGMIHSHTTPLPGRFKDYIALPKPNGYQSLHTSIIGLLKKHRKQPTEIQIKTYDMLEYSDLGMAAHFDYKEKGSKISTDIAWVKDLKDLTESLGNNDFMDSLKIDIFKDRLFILTPKGATRNLPVGSTPIDFAYSIHTDLGNHISIAKVNGKVHPLDKELNSGDVVEIIIDKSRQPNPLWLSFVKTSKAKSCIKSGMKKEDKEMHRERGKGIINKYFEKSGLDILDKDLTLLKILDSRVNSVEERWNILEQVGNFSIAPSALIRKIIRENNLESIALGNKKANKKIENSENLEEKEDKKSQIIYIGGEKDIPYRLGHCMDLDANEGENRILAHINGKGIITVHRFDCSTLDFVNKDRLLSAFYEGDENASIFVEITFGFYNNIGVLKELSAILYSMNINTMGISTGKKVKDKIDIKLSLEIQEYDYLIIDRFIDRVKFGLNSSYVEHTVNHIST